MMKSGCAATAAFLAIAALAGPGPARAAAYSTDPDVPAATVESWGMQTTFFRSTRFEIVSWDEAQKILLAQHCIGGKQYHTGWVTIYAPGGEQYLVQPPRIDELFAFFKRHTMKGEGFAPE
jgi:hypothetical protein